MVGTIIVGELVSTGDIIIDAQLDDSEYRVGGTVTITGEVSPEDEGALVAIRVLNPSGAIYQVNQVPINAQGEFEYSFGLGGALAIAGYWTAELTYRGVQEELAFTVINIEAPISGFPFVINSIHLEDISGTEINPAQQGRPAMIMIDVTNQVSSIESYIVLLQVRDAADITTFISWQTGVASPSENFEVGISWTPETSGTFSVMAFVWDNLSSPEILSEAVEVTVQVES
jgi:hypothetical protein